MRSVCVQVDCVKELPPSQLPEYHYRKWVIPAASVPPRHSWAVFRATCSTHSETTILKTRPDAWSLSHDQQLRWHLKKREGNWHCPLHNKTVLNSICSYWASMVFALAFCIQSLLNHRRCERHPHAGASKSEVCRLNSPSHAHKSRLSWYYYTGDPHQLFDFITKWHTKNAAYLYHI